MKKATYSLTVSSKELNHISQRATNLTLERLKKALSKRQSFRAKELKGQQSKNLAAMKIALLNLIKMLYKL